MNDRPARPPSNKFSFSRLLKSRPMLTGDKFALKLQSALNTSPGQTMHFVNDSMHASGYAALFALATFFIGLFVFKSRSLYFSAGAVLPVAFLDPWLAALAGGVFAYLACVFFTNVITKQAYSDYLLPALIAALAFVIFPPFLALQSETNEIITSIKKSEDVAWERIKHSGKAGAFVEAKYRPCIAPPIQAAIPLPRGSSHVIKTSDPVVCASGTVTLAREMYGPELAAEVIAVIEDLPKQLALTPDISDRLDLLIGVKKG